MKQFTKSDLKDYMKVVNREGTERIVKGGILSNVDGNAVISQVITEDLRWVYKDVYHKRLDIVEVHEPTLDGWNLLWKREGTKYMLLFPKEMFGKEYSLIADKRGTYQPYPVAYDIGPDTKRTFTKEEINEIPFNTDIFTKVEIEK